MCIHLRFPGQVSRLSRWLMRQRRHAWWGSRLLLGVVKKRSLRESEKERNENKTSIIFHLQCFSYYLGTHTHTRTPMHTYLSQFIYSHYLHYPCLPITRSSFPVLYVCVSRVRKQLTVTDLSVLHHHPVQRRHQHEGLRQAGQVGQLGGAAIGGGHHIQGRPHRGLRPIFILPVCKRVRVLT